MSANNNNNAEATHESFETPAAAINASATAGSDSEEEDLIVPSEFVETKYVPLTSVPDKSNKRYTTVYNEFKTWLENKNIATLTEETLIDYFKEVSKTLTSATLWSRYSMLKTTIRAYDDIDISVYRNLSAYLKKENEGYKPKKSKTFTTSDVSRFCREAPDEEYLVTKVIMIIGITGGCRREELTRLTIKDVDDYKTMLLIRIPKLKTGIERTFTVVGEFYNVCKRYMEIRSLKYGVSDRFFLQMSGLQCLNQPIGINRIGSIPKEIATFLDLPEPSMYTGHCFRRTAATLLADAKGLPGSCITMMNRSEERESIDNSVDENFSENFFTNTLKLEKIVTNSIRNSVNSMHSSKRSREENQLPSTSTGSADVTINVNKRLKDSGQNDVDPLAQSFTTATDPLSTSEESNEKNDVTVVVNDVNSSRLLTNVLKLDKNVSLHFNNCYVTINVLPKNEDK